MVLATNLGFPRIGAQRDLKKAVESYWKGKSDAAALQATAKDLRARHWRLQQEAGLDHIPSNDFSFYDQILDLTCTLGLIPQRYQWDGSSIAAGSDLYFAMARGAQKSCCGGAHDGGSVDVTAMEMTKWFDTNYHYIVPEFEEGMTPKLSSTKIIDEYKEAKALGIETRPVLVGPLTYINLGKPRYDGFDYAAFGRAIVDVYVELLQQLSAAGAQWVQIDEPAFVVDVDQGFKDAASVIYQRLSEAAPDLNILVTTYFDSLRDNADTFYSLPVEALHIDLCRGAGQANTAANDVDALLEEALQKIGDKKLSLGLIDGRNIWKNDLSLSLARIEKAVKALGSDRVFVAPSCSLLHTPVDLAGETQLDTQIKSWLAFATQKVQEIAILAKGANEGHGAIAQDLAASDAVQDDRRGSPRIHDTAVKARYDAITADMKQRKSPFAQRIVKQQQALNLPAFPTTTIGSFPQTQEIRKARAAFKKKEIDEAAYKEAMKAEIRAVVDFQHEVDLDVLVHGEPERNDMVEYFGEQLSGFTFSKNGWVQSYGSRCVKPPIIFGDVSRPNPMTVEWALYAQEQTDKIMKGMLTGPITILQWSFVRDDQPRSITATQIALAIRDEVQDLEAAGIKMIQIDEAAFREGLPLRRADWQAYLDNAVENFRLSASGVADETQIHTHMCYSEFNDVIESIGAMDADVISIETSRSQMELLEAFGAYRYPNQIGPGVYDIHSPRIPSTDEMVALLDKAVQVLSAEQLWVNPDCGLKTRGWAEVKPALQNMVEAAKQVRAKAGSKKASAAA